MLRMALNTDKGPIGIVGINDENAQRMRAGMPLDIDLKAMTPPGEGPILRVLIHLAHTYEQVLDDMARDGIPVTDELYQNARDMDAQLLRERREKARQSAR